MLLQLTFLLISFQEIAIIACIVLLLFGGKKIPELMRGLGSGIKSFKEGMRDGDQPTQKTTETKKKDEEKKD